MIPSENTCVIHIGAEIRKKLKSKKRSVVWFSSMLPCTRTNVYKLFKKTNVDTQTLYRVSQVLEFDFFKEYSKELTRKR